MSSNLFKCGYNFVQSSDKRVIDSNNLIHKRLEELSVKAGNSKTENANPDGFTEGLNAPKLESQDAAGDDGATAGNVIKAEQSANQVLEKAKQEADALLADAKEQAKQWQEQAEREIEQKKKDIFARAEEQGYEQGKSKAASEALELEKQYREKQKELEEHYQNLVEELEPRFIDTLSGIYEHIFQVDLSSHRGILTYLISTTMRNLEGSRNYMIHVSKEDYPYVSMQKKQLIASTAAVNANTEVIEDASLARNECLIETDNGIFDCGLGTQLSELTQKLKLLSYHKEQR